MESTDQRHHTRIALRFYVAVDGVDEFPRLCHGNLSRSGIYFDTDRMIGQPGSVQWLYVAAEEQQEPMAVMARVIRVATVSDLERGTVPRGIALQFMVETEESREGLERLVEEVAALQQVHRPLDGAPEQTPDTPQVRWMVLDTSWGLQAGEEVQVEVRAPSAGRPVLSVGTVDNVIPVDRPGQAPLYRADIKIHDHLHPGQPPAGEGTMDLLFSDLLATSPGMPISHGDMEGTLSRVRLPSLLSFFELERISGRLEISREGEYVTLYLKDGRILDVDTWTAFPTIQAAMSELHTWKEGVFKFVLGAARP